MIDLWWLDLGLAGDPALLSPDERERAAKFVSGHDYDPEGQGPARARLYEELGELYPRFGWDP